MKIWDRRTNHVQYISNTISRNISILCKLKYYVPSNILFILYTLSLIKVEYFSLTPIHGIILKII